MMHILGSIPHEVALGFSGGADSLFALVFLAQTNRKIHVHMFDHGTTSHEPGKKIFRDVVDTLRDGPATITFSERRIKGEPDSNISREMYWRQERYERCFFKVNMPLITAHHLDDQLENWVITGIRTGNPRLIPYRNQNVIRPFLAVSREEITQYLTKKGFTNWYTDPTNSNPEYMRSSIRMNVIPDMLKAHPGFRTVIKKKVIQEYENNPDYE